MRALTLSGVSRLAAVRRFGVSSRPVRLRIPELLRQKGVTPYRLSKLSGGRISLSTAYRLARLRGRLHSFDSRLCEVLCEILKVTPGDLFELEPRRRRR